MKMETNVQKMKECLSELPSTNMLNYVIAFVSEFSKRYGIEGKQAFNYLHRFEGIQFLCQHYQILHTLSFDDAIDSLTVFCKQNGGRLQ